MYYQCTAERGKVFRGDVLHEKVEEILYHLTFSETQVENIYKYARTELAKTTNFRTASLKAKEQEFRDVSGKIEKLEEKMINDQIDTGKYKVWFSKLSAQRGA